MKSVNTSMVRNNGMGVGGIKGGSRVGSRGESQNKIILQQLLNES